MTALAETYASTYLTLFEAKPITCAVKGTVFDAVPAPSVVILDVGICSQLSAVYTY